MRRIKAQNVIGKGRQTVTQFNFENAVGRAFDIENRIVELLKIPVNSRPAGEYRRLVERLKDLCAERQFVVENLIVNRGFQPIALRLGNDTTYDGILNYGALGTSATTPAAGDTALGAEVNRTTPASYDVSNALTGVVIVSFFWSKASFTNSNINEFGSFVEGGAGADTGRLFNHSTFAETINKTSSVSVTVDEQITLANG